MVRVTLGTGEVIESFHVQRGIAANLIIHTDTLSFVEAARIFSNPEATKKIIVSSDDEESTYYNYTNLMVIHTTPVIGDDTLAIELQK